VQSPAGGAPPTVELLFRARLSTALLACQRHVTLKEPCLFLGAVMPAPRWAIGGEMTHVVHPRGSLMSGRFVDYRVSRISGRVQPVMRSARATAS
jgi:hypothetical protein